MKVNLPLIPGKLWHLAKGFFFFFFFGGGGLYSLTAEEEQEQTFAAQVATVAICQKFSAFHLYRR